MEEKRRRLYEVIVYDDYVESLALAEKLPNCRYYWILHDMDKTEDNEPKKRHFHLLLHFNEGITLTSLCKKLHLQKSNMVSFWNANDPNGRKDNRVRYLVHYKSKDPLKHEYDIKMINTNDENIDKYFYDEETSKQSKDIILLFDYFDSHKSLLSFRTFLNFVYEQGLWGTYWRNASIFNRLFDEHNREVKEQIYEEYGQKL